MACSLVIVIEDLTTKRRPTGAAGRALRAPAGLVEPAIGFVSIARLAVIMLFRPDVAAGDIQRMVEAPELACVNHAICAEIAFHCADFALFVHQLAEFGAAQIAFTLPAWMRSICRS